MDPMISSLILILTLFGIALIAYIFYEIIRMIIHAIVYVVVYKTTIKHTVLGSKASESSKAPK